MLLLSRLREDFLGNMNEALNIPAPKKVLIVLLGAIGDVTRALPLALRIKKEWPAVYLAWAVEPKSFGVLEGHTAIDRIIVFNRPGGFSAYRAFLQELRDEKFDLVFDLQRHLKSGFTSYSTGSSFRLGFARKNAKEGNWFFNNYHIEEIDAPLPKILHYQKFGDFLGLTESTPLEFGLTVDHETQTQLDLLWREQSQVQGFSSLPESSKRVALILGSSWKSRFWPSEYYQALIEEMFRRFGVISILIGGKSERVVADQIMRGVLPGRVLNLVEKTKLRELKAVFLDVLFAIGSDSGPMHIAAAVGTPVISLWGATSPLRSAPYGSEQYVLQSDVPCAPCYLRECPGLNNLCMRKISVEDVLRQVEALLKQGKTPVGRVQKEEIEKELKIK